MALATYRLYGEAFSQFLEIEKIQEESQVWNIIKLQRKIHSFLSLQLWWVKDVWKCKCYKNFQLPTSEANLDCASNEWK